MKSKANSRISINQHLPKHKDTHRGLKIDRTMSQYSSLVKWATIISSHPNLYRPLEHNTLSNYRYFQIELLEISELQVLLGKRRQYLQVSCIIYDKHAQSFVGSTYCSEMFEIEAKGIEKPFCACKKSIYFYTHLPDIALKVDIWRLESEKNSKGIENMSKRIYVGHFEVELGESRESGIIQKQLISDELKRFSLINQEDQHKTQQHQQSAKKPSKIVYRVINSDSLSHLHHFIPSDHLFDQHDSILGLKDRTIGTKGYIEMGDRSRLTFQVKSLAIPMATIKYLTETSQQKINSIFVTMGRPTISIKQIRLNLQFHNGWKSVSYQSLLLKQTISQSAILDTNRSVAITKTQSKIHKGKEAIIKTKTYAYDKAKELKAVFKGQNGVLILWIQAKIQSKFDVMEQKIKSKSELFWLPVAFAIKALPQSQQQQNLTIELVSGNPYNLANLTTYLLQYKKGKDNKEESKDKLQCSMSVLLQKSIGTIENIETVEKEIHDIQNLKMEKERLQRLKRKIRQQKRKKMIELNQQIPFLDTIQLKEQLYQQQIGRIKGQKQEQQHILLYLRDKINQLQRQAFKNQLNFHQHSDQEDFQSNTIKVQKLPNHFIDFRHETPLEDTKETIPLNYFNRRYCQQAQSQPKFASSRLIEQCFYKDTYIQFKLTHFETYFQEIKTFKLLITNFEGSFETLSFTSHQYENKTVQIKINLSIGKTQQILNHLLNGYLQLYLQCNNNKHLHPFALITLSQLIDKCNDEGDLLASIDNHTIFMMQSTIVAYASFTIAFTNNCSVLKPTQSKPTQHQKYFYAKPQQSNIMNRIKRFKQGNGSQDSKLQVINQIIRNSKINTIDVQYRQRVHQQISLNVHNNSLSKETFVVYIFDQDSAFVEQDQLTIPSLSKSNNYKFEIEGNSSQQLSLVYASERANISFNALANASKSNAYTFYKHYNHQHKITVNIAKSKTNIIVERYQILIHPMHNQNSLTINQFVFKQQSFAFPIQPNNLQIVAQANLTITNTSLNLMIPQFDDQVFISQFSLQKQLKDKKVTFQSIQFYSWKCQRMEVTGRLWQKKDVLLKIPIEVILERQISLTYLIQEIRIVSRHINVRIRQFGEFTYESQLKINRKNSQILIRAQLSFNQIGKCTYGVEIADKNSLAFHRIGINFHIQYPNLPPHQIINVKVPKESLGNLQPFAYQNKQQVGLNYTLKCNQPHLLTFKQSKTFLKIEQEWIIQMSFNWERITNEMREEQKEQVSILVGILSDLAIDYILFRCKLN